MERFRLVFRGQLDPALDPVTVRERLSRLTGWDAEKIERFLAAAEVVLKTGLSREAAERSWESLRRAGVMCACEREDPEPTPALRGEESGGATGSREQRSASRPGAAPTVPAPVSAKPASTWLVFLALAATVAGGWWLNHPAASPAPAGAYVSPTGGYAVVPPDDWLLISPTNYRTIIKEYGDQIPRDLRRLIEKPKFDVSFFQIPASAEDFANNINIIVMPAEQGVPTLDEGERQKATAALEREMRSALPDYTVTESRLTTVDRLTALSITGTAELKIVLSPAEAIYSEPGAFGWRHVTGHREEVAKTVQMTSIQTLIPGKKRAYIFSCAFDGENNPDGANTCNSLLKGFVVTERPPRFGPIVMGGINGGLLGAGLYLAMIFVGRLARLGTKG